MPRLFFSPKRGAVSYADVTSANIVGYQNKELDNVGYNLITPTFTKIDGTKINLQEIKLEGAMGDQSEKIVVLNAGGNINGIEYCWLSEAMGAPEGDGWYNGDTWAKYTDVTFSQGEGLYLYAPNSVTITTPFSGQVDMGEQKVPLAQGYSFVGNSSPRDLNLQEIKLEGAMGDQSEKIVVLTAGGNINGVEYCWLSEAMGAPEGDGWYNGDTWAKYTDVTIKAGDALWVYQPNTDQSKLVLPAIKTK